MCSSRLLLWLGRADGFRIRMVAWVLAKGQGGGGHFADRHVDVPPSILQTGSVHYYFQSSFLFSIVIGNPLAVDV